MTPVDGWGSWSVWWSICGLWAHDPGPKNDLYSSLIIASLPAAFRSFAQYGAGTPERAPRDS